MTPLSERVVAAARAGVSPRAVILACAVETLDIAFSAARWLLVAFAAVFGAGFAGLLLYAILVALNSQTGAPPASAPTLLG